MGLFDDLFAPNAGWLGAALAQRLGEPPSGAARPPADGNTARGIPSYADPFGPLSQLMPPQLLPPSQAAPSPLYGAAVNRAGLDERAYGAPGASGQPGPPLSLAPPRAPPPDISVGDRLSAGLLGFLNGRAPPPALGNLIEGLATGRRSDQQR